MPWEAVPQVPFQHRARPTSLPKRHPFLTLKFVAKPNHTPIQPNLEWNNGFFFIFLNRGLAAFLGWVSGSVLRWRYGGDKIGLSCQRKPRFPGRFLLRCFVYQLDSYGVLTGFEIGQLKRRS